MTSAVLLGNENSAFPVSVSPVVNTSNEAYSFNQACIFKSYLSFKVSSFSKTDIRELRKRFSSELNQVRVVINRIESGHFGNVSQKKVNVNNNRLGLRLVSKNNEIEWGVLLKECGNILRKLLKHKFAYVFNAPVDVIGLNLHDYHTIVKRPMDLGTVKANLGKKVYSTPMEFAGDVRLTFNNALLYNPKLNVVNGMAEQMLACFEELFKPIQQKIDFIVNRVQEFGVNPVRISSPRGIIKNDNVIEKPIERMQQMPVVQTHSNLPPLPVVHQQQFTPLPVKETMGVGRPAVKQPKPRARDVNKRDMSMEEKQELGYALQNIPGEKMLQLVQIIRKCNECFAQDDDEVELDIDTLDTETLWELDRFVINWKKHLSKCKRQSLLVNNNPTSVGAVNPSTPVMETDVGAMSDKNDSVKKPKDNEDEDVDIGDDMPITNFPPVEIEKDEGGGVGEVDDQGQDNASLSSSSSSGSDSSSSSDSDSGSSSKSDSDADEAQS